jgi:type VI secretion system secreted protein VgrG
MAPSTFAKVATSLGDEMLLLTTLSGYEALGRPFAYELELISHDATLDFQSVLNTSATVTLELKENQFRYINGIVTRFGRIGDAGRHSLYRATIRPWLWLLSRSMDSRIFPNMTIPDVIKLVFRDHNFSDFDVKLSRDYRTWEYLVQYRESAFNFVSRLLEQEGLYYYFEHTDGSHKLIITDSHANHNTLPGYAEIPYYPPVQNEARDRDHVDGWRVTQELQTGSCVVNDFDFRKPKADLLARRNGNFSPNHFELYDYPGEYEELKDGEAYVRLWKEQVDAEFEKIEGQGNARGLVAGSQFKLTNFPREDQNRKYVVTSTTCRLDTGAFESTQRTGSGPTYRSTFTVLDSAIPYRPLRETPKPEIRGPQTAIVVGYSGDEEIHTDRYGRVKVHFPWVRKNEYEKVSCWVRVSQIWAGTRWGGMHIPRVGQEVIVEFLEGDPDRPIITGRVYNADNMPPYTLPDNKTQSGIKSRSTKDGGMDNFNELRFEDKKGDEQLYMQAEKNMDTLVKNDQSLTVGANRTKDIGQNETTTVGIDRTETVGSNESITIGMNRTESVGVNESITIGAMRVEQVGGAENVTITLARAHEIGLADSLTVGGARTVQVGALHSVSVKGPQSIDVGGPNDVNVGGAQSVKVKGADSLTAASQAVTLKGAQTIKVKADRTVDVGGSETVKVAKNVVIDAGDQITIKAGKASITLKKNGDIMLNGKNITSKGSGKTTFKSAGNMVLKASKIGEN